MQVLLQVNGLVAPFGIPGKVAGPMIGAFLTSMGINTGALQNEIKELDPNAKAPWVSLAFGAGAGALDAVGLKSLVSPMLKWATPEVVYRNAIASGFPKVMALDAVKAASLRQPKGQPQRVQSVQVLKVSKRTWLVRLLIMSLTLTLSLNVWATQLLVVQ